METQIIVVESVIMHKIVTTNILGVNVANLTLKNIVPTLLKLIDNRKEVTIFGANAHAVNIYQKDKKFRKAIDNATMIYPEGFSMIFASKLLGKRFRGKTTLMDFIFEFFKECEKNKWKVYLLGGREEVSKKALKNLQKKFPKLKIWGYHGYFLEQETMEIIAKINKVNPKILFVAMGSPKQEVWIDKNKNKINAHAFFGIGGSIDIISGVIPRAPKIMSNNGLEWLYRFYKEPKRLWKRYITGNSIFLLRVLQNKIT